MKKTLKIIGVLCFSLSLFYVSIDAYAGESISSQTVVKEVEVKVTKELEEKFPLKPVHGNLVFECVFCHQGQGSHAEEFTAPDEEVCLECHKSKEFLATRLSFMDTLKANPHNSIHDGPNLYCDECHNEHIPSVNMCSECHEKEIEENLWMKETP